mgnify:CR=1 FL=1
MVERAPPRIDRNFSVKNGAIGLLADLWQAIDWGVGYRIKGLAVEV